ncbi:MAG TPA: hypothetical protein VMD25_13015 [Acidobacteriaceae bacterium]|nr:hypothetical protein [Acidobacteriaceae bacterium]
MPIPIFGAMLALSCAAQTAPSPAQDAAALVRRAVAKRLAEDATHKPLEFAFYKKDDRRSFVQQIVETQQGDVAMLVSVNGAPLTPVARQNEMNRLNTLAANPTLQQHRQIREQADQARIDKLLHMLPDAFLYHYDQTVPCNVNALPAISLLGPSSAATEAGSAPDSQCYHLTFTPNPDWDAPDMESRVLRGMAGDVLIEVSDERLHQLNAHLIADVDFGWGIVGRLNKGGTIFLEQDRIGPNDWELTHMRMNLTGRALMVKPLSFRMNEEESRFAQVPSMPYTEAIRMLESQASWAQHHPE